MKPLARVETFSQGKIPERNEDYSGHSKDSFVLADGATDKSKRIYQGQTGGEIVSHLIVRECLTNKLNGNDLVEFLNAAVHGLYEQYEILDDIQDPKFRFTAGFATVRLEGDIIHITQVGDVGIRINGQAVYQYKTKVDENSAELRSSYIQQTGDIAGSRDYLMPELLKQFQYQNNPDHALGYGVIDGITTPTKYIHVLDLDRRDTKTIELFTDGYFDIPNGQTIKDWEETYKRIEREDPDKYLRYKSTKSKDDRTIVIIHF